MRLDLDYLGKNTYFLSVFLNFLRISKICQTKHSSWMQEKYLAKEEYTAIPPTPQQLLQRQAWCL